MSWMINASAPASYTCQAIWRGLSSSSRRMVLSVMKNAAVEAVRVLHQALDVSDVVARAGPRRQSRAADVDGIGAVVDGFDANVCVARRR